MTTAVNLNWARDEQDQLCRSCAFDVLTACRCVIACGAVRCMGACPRCANLDGTMTESCYCREETTASLPKRNTED